MCNLTSPLRLEKRAIRKPRLKGEFGLASLAIVLVVALALAGLYDLGLQITGMAAAIGPTTVTYYEQNGTAYVFNTTGVPAGAGSSISFLILRSTEINFVNFTKSSAETGRGLLLPAGTYTFYGWFSSSVPPGSILAAWELGELNETSGSYAAICKVYSTSLGGAINPYNASCTLASAHIISPGNKLRVRIFGNNTATNKDVTIFHYWGNTTYNSRYVFPQQQLGNLSIDLSAPLTDPNITASQTFVQNCTVICAGGDCIGTAVYAQYNDGSGWQNISSTGTLVLNGTETNPHLILGTGNFSGSESTTFVIKGNLASDNTIRCAATSLYNGNPISPQTTNVTVNPFVDTTSPQWSDNKAFPTSPATYSPTQNYQFNITWTDNVAISTVMFEHNFTGAPANNSPSGNMGSEYYYNYGALAVGTYYWKSYANDTSGNANATPQFQYVVNRATSTCSLTFAPSSPQTYGTPVTASCSCTNPEAAAKLYRNGTDVTATENGTATTLPAGTWFYNCTVNQTQNYTYADNTSTYVIYQATPVLTLTISPSTTVTYGTLTNASCTANTAQVTPQLYRNGTLVSNPDVQTLAAGTYNYTCNSTATQNYTSASTSQLLTVNKQATMTYLYLNGARNNLTVTYPTQTNATAVTSNGSVTLYRNGTPVSNPEITTLAAGFYNYTAINPGNENYTSSSETWFLTVNKANSTVNLTLNGIDNDTSAPQYSIVNITGYVVTPSTGYIEIRENGTLLISGQSPQTILKNYTIVGAYNITVIYNETQNYTSSFETHILTITPVDTTPPQWSNNKTSPTSPTTYSPAQTYQFNITWTDDAAVSAVRFEHNFTGAPANNSPSGNVGSEYYYNYGPLTAGTYYWKSYANDTSNNKNETPIFPYTVVRATPVLTINASPSFTVTYGTPTSVSCTADTAQVTPQLYRNGTLVSNPDVQTLAAGTYNYTCNSTATQNYTSASTSQLLTVNKAASAVNLTLNGVDTNITVFINQSVNITGAVITPSTGYIELYDNGTLISSGPSPLTSIRSYATEGVRNITVVYNATQNYTSSFETHFINVSVTDATPPTVTFVLPTPANDTKRSANWIYVNATVTDGQSPIGACTFQFNGVNYSMTRIGSGLSVSCFRNHTGISDGTYSYKVYANDSFGNIGISETRTVTIDTMPPATVTNLNETATGENWIYWTWTNPPDADFNHTQVWLNGTFKANISAPASSYNATGLVPNTTYQIQTRTVDNVGNINTTWINDTATTNVSIDTTPPIISNVRNGTVTDTTAEIFWDTDDFSNSSVLYGIDPANLSLIAIDATYVQNHSILLDNLTPNMTYYYNVSSCSPGGCSVSGPYNFTTSAAVALLPDGSACTLAEECAGGFCVHNICRSSETYCGDAFCDSGESCSSCPADCGPCPRRVPAPYVPLPPAPPPAPPPAAPPLLAEPTEQQISTVTHAEPGYIAGEITFAPAGVAARIDLSIIATPISEIAILPSVDIKDARIEVKGFDAIRIDNRVEFVTTRLAERAIAPVSYTPDVGEFVYSAFSIEHTGLEGKIREVVLKFKLDKRWIQANAIDPATGTLRRHERAQEWQLLETYLIDEDADYYYYVGISPRLSTFSIVATSPPLLCAVCKPGDWSACIDGEQTRLSQDCGSHTGYTCRPIVESRLCEVPAVPAPPHLPLDIIIIPVIGLAIGSYIIFSKKG